MNEKQRILEMVAQGKLTAQDALELLEALEEPKVETKKDAPIIITGKRYRTLKVIVLVEKDNVNVNVNIPLGIVRAVGGMMKDFSHMVPEEAQKKMHEHGVDLTMLDIEGILHALEEGTIDNPELVNIEVNNAEEGEVKVKIYLDEN